MNNVTSFKAKSQGVRNRKRVFRGDRLREIREKQGWSQDELAVKLGFGQSQMNKYENGKSDPTSEVLVRLATALNVSVDWLLGLVETPNGHVQAMVLSPEEQRLVATLRGGDFMKLLRIKARVPRLRTATKTLPASARSRAAYQRRRAARAKVLCTFTTEHEQRALDYFNGRCAVCGRQLEDLFSTHRLNWDHWVPITRGGHTSPDNMLPLCGGINGCNNRKNNKLPDEWLRELYPDHKARTIEQRISAYFEWAKTQDGAS